MDKKFGIALVALIGIGIFALPSTIALFSGQHSFYNIDATGNQVPCVKCHGDVKAELGSNDNSVTLSGSVGPHKDFQCEYCHRAEVGFSSGDDAYALITYNGTGSDLLYLVTTIGAFETGNFPKKINYALADTVDTLIDTADAQNWDGTQFGQQEWQKIGSVGTGYPGAIGVSTGALAGMYKYNKSEEYATTSISGADASYGAFNPRDVSYDGTTWSGTTGTREVTPGTRYHAASLVSCMECHGGEQKRGAAGYEINTTKPYNHAGWVTEDITKCKNCHYGTGSDLNSEFAFEAGGFGLTTFGKGNDTGSVEAHKEFVKTTSVDGVLRAGPGQEGGYGAANIACVACHTHVAVDINFQKKYKVEFDAIAPNDLTQDWVVDNFKANGTVNISIYGNQSGATWATGNKSMSWDPATDLYINGNGAKVNGLSNANNDSAAALQ